MAKFYLEITNDALRTTRLGPSFDTVEAAVEYANGEASRSRKFMLYEVWEDRPKPVYRKFTGLSTRGEK